MKKTLLILLLSSGVSAADIELIAVGGSHASLTRDGQLIAFEIKNDLHVYDRQTKKLERITAREPARRTAGLGSGGPDISANGNLLAYHSYTSGTESGSQPRRADIRVFNRRRQTTELLTPAYGSKPQDGEALFPQLGLNGQYVLFTSNASNLLPSSRDGLRAAYLFDRYKNSLELVSKNAAGAPADRGVGDPKISQNGRYVFFKSAATNLAGKLPPAHLSSHLYRVDRWRNEVARIDDEDFGFDETRWSTGRYAINDDGGIVVFEGRDRKAADYDKQLESTTLFLFDESTVSIHPLLSDEYANKAHSPSLSADGRYVAFAARPNGVLVFDREANNVQRLSDAVAAGVVISADGRTVAFESKDLKQPAGAAILQPAMKKGTSALYITKNPL